MLIPPHERRIFSDEHHAYRDSVRRFFKAEIEPAVGRWEREGGFTREIFRKAGAAGLLCPMIPTEYGGAGGDLLHEIVLHEEHGYSPAGAAFDSGLSVDLAALVVLAGGTEEQKRELIPRYVSGELITDILVTEPHSGSDVAGVRTTARRDGDDYIVNGTKMWITCLHLSTLLPVVVRTDANKRGASGLSILLIDPESPGVDLGKPIETLLRGTGNVGMVAFNDVRVPARNLLGGAEGHGMKQAFAVLNAGRLCLGARMLAMCELAFEMTLEFVKNREGFGQRIFDFQNTQFRLADMKTDLRVGRGFLDSCLERAMREQISVEETAMVKLWISEMEARVIDQAVQLHGGMGVANEHPISKMYTYARPHRIYAGTSEVLRHVIGRGL